MLYEVITRRSEGEALNVKDVSFKSSLLYVRDGKGGKRRVVPINEKVLNDFKNYIYYERNAQQNFGTERSRSETAYICNNSGTRMKGDKLNKVLKELLLKAGIQKETCTERSRSISLHNLRHSIATHLLENGMTVEYVRDFLGHKHLEATQIYTRVSKRKLRKL